MGFDYQSLASGQFQMPDGWKLTTIEEVAKVNEKAITPKNAPPHIRYIDIASVDKGKILDIQELSFKAAPSRARRVVRDKDSLISTVRPNLEHYMFVKEPEPNTIASTGFAVVSAKAVVPRFLYYYMTSKPFTAYLTQIAESHTSAYPAFNPDVIEQAELILPKDDEQRAIAHILGSLDDKIELNRRMNQTLEATARAIFKSWFVDFLPVRAKMAAKANDPLLLLPQAEPGMWFVYAIECEDGSLYIGQTEDLRQRWLQHASGKGGTWTKTHPPKRVVYWERQPSREEAVEREKWLKTGFGRKWLKKEVAAIARTQTGDPVRAKGEGRPIGLPDDIAALFPDSFEDSELGEIPKGWEVKTIGDVVEFAYGKALKASDRKPGDVPVFGSNGQVGLHNKALVKGPGIVIGRKGNPGIVTWSYEDFFPIDTTFYVKRTRVISSLKYLFFALKTQDLPSLSADSAVPGLNRNLAYLSKILIPHEKVLTPFDGHIDPLFQMIYANEKEINTLASLRDTLLPKLISGELRIPEAEAIVEGVE
mgnify:CR=1 FL=1